MRTSILTTLIIFMLPPLMGQNYTRDAGIRLGSVTDFTYRQVSMDDSAFELMLGFSNRGMRITALKEYFRPAFINETDRLYRVIGFGAHAGFGYTNYYSYFGNRYYYNAWRFSPIIGIDGIIGLEYLFEEFPFIVGADIQPYFEFSTNRFFALNIFNISISLKYRF